MSHYRAWLIASICLLSSLNAAAYPQLDYNTLINRCFAISALVLPLNDAMFIQGANRAAQLMTEHSFVPASAFSVHLENPLNTREIPLVQRVTSTNINDIVNYAWNQNNAAILGAKGVIVEIISGKFEVVFWSQGQGNLGNNIHHKDVVASIINHHANILEGYSIGNDNDALLTQSVELRRLALKLQIDRGQSVYPDIVLQKFQGFQVSGVKNSKGVVEITNIDIDSSLTSTQASRQIKFSAENVNTWYAEIAKRIDTSLLARKLEYGYKRNMLIEDRANLKAPNSKTPLGVD